MKTRIITAIVGLLLLFGTMLLFETPVFNLMLGIVSAIGTAELLKAAGVKKFKPFYMIYPIFAGLLPFASFLPDERWVLLIGVAFVFAGLFLMLKFHESADYAEYAVALCSALLIGSDFSVFVCVRNMQADLSVRVFYILLIFCTAWLTDTFAYFSGRAFGKHKMAPKVSPHKTVEGAIGGVIGCVLIVVSLGFGYNAYAQANGIPPRADILLLSAVALVLSVLGMLGDLTFSAIKRHYGIKDYGNIMPGHGGVLDRFDSVLFTAPALFLLLQFVQIIR